MNDRIHAFEMPGQHRAVADVQVNQREGRMLAVTAEDIATEPEEIHGLDEIAPVQK